jgi:hypothetical protein
LAFSGFAVDVSFPSLRILRLLESLRILRLLEWGVKVVGKIYNALYMDVVMNRNKRR